MASVTHQALLMQSAAYVPTAGWFQPLSVAPKTAPRAMSSINSDGAWMAALAFAATGVKGLQWQQPLSIPVRTRRDISGFNSDGAWLAAIRPTAVAGNVSWQQPLSVPIARSKIQAPSIVDPSSYAQAWIRPPFPPITGLIGWWDAQVTASITRSGFNISSVADQSGGGNTMNRAGSSNFPTYSATGFNTSYPAMVFFGGSLAGLQATPFPMGTGATLTMWYVGTLMQGASKSFGRFTSYTKPTAAADQNNVGSFAMNTFSSLSTVVQVGNNSVFPAVTGLAASPAGHRIIVTKDGSGLITIYVDNIAGATGTSVGNWVSAGWMNIGMQHASITSGTDFVSASVGEVGIATGYSDATAVGLLDAYLKSKWGL